MLSELRSEVPFAAPDTLIEKALVLTGFEAVWAPLQGGDQALANIRKVVGLSRTLGNHSLDELVSYIRRRRDELEAREGQAVLDTSGRRCACSPYTGPRAWSSPSSSYPRPTFHRVGTTTPSDGAPMRASPSPSTRRSARAGAVGVPGFYSHLTERDSREEVSEHRRLLYVAATRAADKLYLSGDDSRSGDGWLTYVLEALKESPLDGVEIHPPVPVDLDAIARRPQPTTVTVPTPGAEVDIMPTLVARPPVIPLRSSTPVTALRKPLLHAPGRHGDGLSPGSWEASLTGPLSSGSPQEYAPLSLSWPKPIRRTGGPNVSPPKWTPCSTCLTPALSRQPSDVRTPAHTSSCRSPGTGTERPCTGPSISPTNVAAPGT